MKKSTKWVFAFPLVCGMALLPSCKDDKTENGGIDEIAGVENDQLTPDQAKEYLENTANMLVDKLTPDNHRKLLDFAEDFANEYGDYDFPEFMDEEDLYAPPSSWGVAPMKVIAAALRGGDYEALTRAFDEYVYEFDEFAGIYEADKSKEEFVKVGNSKDQIVIRCDVKGNKTELVAKKSGSSWSYTYEEDDRYYGDSYRYKVVVPERVNVTLTYGGEQLASAETVSHYNMSAKTADLSSEFKTENMQVKGVVNMTNSQITSNATLSVAGSEILVAQAAINGSNLCDIEKIRDFVEKMDDLNDPAMTLETQFLKDGNATVSILNRMQMKGNAKKVSLIVDAMDVDGYFSGSESSAVKKEVQNSCDIINRNIEANLYFTGSDKVQARLATAPKRWKSDYSDYGYWEVATVIIFDADETQYFIDQYFNDSNFGSVVSSFKNLGRRWESFFNRY